MVTIYGLVCPMSGEIRYIGKTDRRCEVRLAAHVCEAKYRGTSHKHRWLRKCARQGLRPEILVLEEVQADVRWQERERAWIKRAIELGLRLTNQTAGGEGLDWLDADSSQAYRRKLAEAARRRLEENPSLKDSLVEGTRRSWKENKESRLAAMKAAWTDEAKANHAARMAEVRARPEFHEIQSMAAKKSWAKHRPKILAAITSPEAKEKQRESGRKKWECPEKRARLMAHWTPEARAAQAAELESRRERMTPSPEGRERQRQKMREYWARRRAEKLEGPCALK